MYSSVSLSVLSFQMSTKRKFDSDLSREQLIQRCEQLEKHVEQLRNTIAKRSNGTKEKKCKGKSTNEMRPFDFTKHSKRHIFLKFLYLGWDYHVRHQWIEKKKII